MLGGQQQQGQQQPQLGQSTAQQPGSSLWSPGRAVTGVHRTVPMQMQIIKDKWDSTSFSSPFRTYLYNNVGDDAAPFYQPGPEDDETKWEEALRKRPSSGYVPVLVRGFWELGKRAQRQKDFLTMMQNRLHEINNCLSDLLSRHDLKISVKIADCRRKHIVLSKRCLALAAKTQVLRNRGYAMDDAEEELKKKLAQLERSVFDPTLNGRGEEIWARMLAIREHSKRLQIEMDRAGANGAISGDDGLDENTMKTVKKVCTLQVRHYRPKLITVRSLMTITLKSNTCRRSLTRSRQILRRHKRCGIRLLCFGLMQLGSLCDMLPSFLFSSCVCVVIGNLVRKPHVMEQTEFIGAWLCNINQEDGSYKVARTCFPFSISKTQDQQTKMYNSNTSCHDSR